MHVMNLHLSTIVTAIGMTGMLLTDASAQNYTRHTDTNIFGLDIRSVRVPEILTPTFPEILAH